MHPTPNLSAVEQCVAEALKRPDAVLFIGSGISQWSSAPSWERLLTQLANFVESRGGEADVARRLVARGDLLDAADFLVEQIKPAELGLFLREKSGLTKLPLHEIHELIATLGPTCFVTTNYDNLIEAALRKSRPDTEFQVVTNRHLPELADIQKTRAINFVFKMHGDLGDVESIVLSQTQYDRLIHGLRPVLDTLKTLLATRPVIFLGFGLRDPDFRFVQALLRETYRGNAGEAFAIVPDVGAVEQIHRQRQLGLRICTYQTVSGPDGKSDHKAFLDLVRRLHAAARLAKNDPAVGQTKERNESASIMFGLARHGARLARFADGSLQTHPIRISLHQWFDREILPREAVRFHHSLATTLFSNYRGSFVIAGAAGSGKSHVLRQFLSETGATLRDTCLSENSVFSGIPVPVYLDQKLYDGDLQRALQEALPADVNVHDLERYVRLCIVLDSVNEVDSQYLENGIWRNDLEALRKVHPAAQIILAVRDPEMLEDLRVPIFVINGVDESYLDGFVRKELSKASLSKELRRLLSNALLLTLALRFSSEVNGISTPGDLHKAVVGNAVTKLAAFSAKTKIMRFLSELAYKMIGEGRELTSVGEVESRLGSILREALRRDHRPFINALISSGLMTAHPEGKLSFFHQTITEYLASIEIGRRFQRNRRLVHEITRTRRWDYALLLAAEQMPRGLAEKYISAIAAADAGLAIRATRFVEHGQARMRNMVLRAIPKRAPDSWMVIEWAHELSELEFTSENASTLRALSDRRDEVGAVALSKAIQFFGARDLRRMINEILNRKFDYNALNFIGPALGSRLTPSTIAYLLSRANSLDLDPDDRDGSEGTDLSVCHGIEKMLANISHAARMKLLPKWRAYKPWLQGVIADSIRELDNSQTRKYLVRMVDAKVPGAEIALYFNLKFDSAHPELAVPSLTEKRLRTICAAAICAAAMNSDRPPTDKGAWWLALLFELCRLSPDWRAATKLFSESTRIAEQRFALSYVCASSSSARKELLREYFIKERGAAARICIDAVNAGDDIVWNNDKQSLVDLLQLRDGPLATTLLTPITTRLSKLSLDIDIGEISWWLSWLEEVERDKAKDPWLLLDRLGTFLGQHTTEKHRLRMLDYLNQPGAPHRSVLARHVICTMRNISVDALSEAGRELLIREHIISDHWIAPSESLGELATEAFIERELLPLRPRLRSNKGAIERLNAILYTAGQKLGRRYI